MQIIQQIMPNNAFGWLSFSIIKKALQDEKQNQTTTTTITSKKQASLITSKTLCPLKK